MITGPLTIDLEIIRENERGRVTEAHLSASAFVLGRILSLLDAPRGVKNEATRLTLPAYLTDAPKSITDDISRVYLHNRGQPHTNSGAMILREKRSDAYLHELARFFQALVRDDGATISISGKNLYLSKRAVDALQEQPVVSPVQEGE